MPCVEKSSPQFASIGLVGYKGRMGAMLSRRFRELGHQVRGIGRVMDKEAVSALEQSRIVLLSVPSTTLEEALRNIAPYLRMGSVLMDVTSVKILPMRLMEEYFPGGVVGAHPLFGPTPDKADMKVALVRGKNVGDGACAEVEQLFGRMGCATFWTTAAEHDFGVAFAQSLNFTVSAAFFCSLARNGNIRPFLTPSFKRHLEAARKHLTTDRKMFCEFTSMNPAFQGALEEYQGILAGVAAGGLSGIADEASLWYAGETE
jgi:prephenate dehydrogenase